MPACLGFRGAGLGYDELVGLAEELPPSRPLVDPDDPALLRPGAMPDRIRELCANSGQPVPEEPGAVVRCILESLALKFRYTIELLATVTGESPREVHVVGGGARNGCSANVRPTPRAARSWRAPRRRP